jgi:hypothetical protein
VESYRTSDSAADGKQGWFKLGQVVITLDTGIQTSSQYALNIDFVSESQDIKTTVELSAKSAKELSDIIQVALSRGVKMGIVDQC